MRSRGSISRRCAPALDAMGIAYEVNPRLVRGLDYYSRTVFEWVTDALGAQDAVCSGGRYDGLIAQLGGEPTPAIGFAAGVERVVELIAQAGSAPRPLALADVYIVASGRARRTRAPAPGRAAARCLAGARRAAQSRRRQLQDAVPPRRSQWGAAWR